RTREIHDALKRRCLYHWVGYPTAERELKIVRAKVPGIGKKLSAEVVHFVQALREVDLFKSPGVAESLDWAAALTELDVVALDPATVSDTLGVLLKYQDDIARLEGTKAKELLDAVHAEMRAAGRCRERRRTTGTTRAKHRLFRARVACRRHTGRTRKRARCARGRAGCRCRDARGFLLDP